MATDANSGDEKLRNLLDNLSGMVYRCRADEHWTMLYASAGVHEVTGYEAEELIENRRISFAELIVPVDRDRVAETVATAIDDGRAFEITYRITTEHGVEKWVWERGRKIKPASGNNPAILEGYITDIADQGHAQEILLKAGRALSIPIGEQFFNELTHRIAEALGLAGAIFALIDRNDSDTLVSQAMSWRGGNVEQGLCYAIAGTPCEPVVREQEELVVSHSAQQRFPDDLMLTKFGIDAYVGVPIIDQEGEALGLVAVFHDRPIQREAVTLAVLQIFASRVRAEIERQKFITQLQQTQRLESIGQLTGGIAHDFNNQLTVILGNCEWLREILPDDAEMHEALEMIESAARSGADMTRRLLAFARRQTLEAKPVDVVSLVENMKTMLARTLESTIKLDIESPQEHWWALTDAAQMENAVLNLCLNARDAINPPGSIRIRIENLRVVDPVVLSASELEPGEYICLSISDTGSGIAPDDINRVFDPFYTTKERGRGSGMGLAMVYGFIRQSEGDVTIDSRPDQGTTIHLYLPRCQPESPAAAPRDQKAEKFDASLEECSILLVEDNELVRRNAIRQFKQLGHRVTSAADAHEALEILGEREDIDLLFTDVLMPGGMTGTELATRARSLRPGLPVLFTTGNTQDLAGGTETTIAGMPLVEKPYRREDLIASIRQVLTSGSRPGDK